ncbi:MAG: hypothetical protein MZV70_74435 [Desulfobacterales bacterium]|nr:hypothetical protein [Desulfobacterales bacterium]
MADAIRTLKSAGLPVFAVGLGRESARRATCSSAASIRPATVLKGATLVAEVVVSQTGLRRPHRPAGRRRRRAGGRVAGRDAAARRRAVRPTRVRFTLAEPGPRVLHVPHRRAGRRAGDAEQRAAGAGHGEGPARARALRRGRAAVRDEVPAPGRGRRRQPPGGDAAAHGGAQVPAPRHRRARGPGRRLPEDARRAVRLPGTGARQHRGRRVHGRPAAHDRRLRQRSAAAACWRSAGRRAFAEGGYAGTAGRRRAAGAARRTASAAADFVEEITVSPTRLGQTHVATQIADTEAAVGGTVGRAAGADDGESRATREAGRGRAARGQGQLARRAQVVLAYQRYGAGKVARHARAGLVDVADARRRFRPRT